MSCNNEPRTYPCTICGDQGHTGPQCPLFYPRETTRDQVSVLHGGMNSKYESRPKFDPYSNTYNPGWRHNPNFSWSKGAHQDDPYANPPPVFSRNQSQVQEPSSVDKKVSSPEENLNLFIERSVINNAEATKNINLLSQMFDNFGQKFDDFVLMSQRSGKTLENSVEPPKDKGPAEKETEVDQTSSKDPNGPEGAKSPSSQKIENALLDLGDSVNLLPSSIYEQLGLGEMKPIKITLQLADSQDINSPTILGRPFLVTTNAVIHCQTGLVEFSFGNQKISVNVFKALQAPPDPKHY
ncbi:uncharacterized protein LOC113360142 [Papaver somniferum]|uniref:uncharacterized protein LOC113360142 n=1 Tax=Papaver somniferum TaxID=3469 RepID=UPI000E6F64CD|nr:uncharacterized protein LOC113360142 [Papaver somniferum]